MKLKKEIAPAIVQNLDGVVLYLCSVNQEAIDQILKTNKMFRYSVSQNRLIEVGSESGKTEYVKDLRTNCYEDTLLAIVEQTKPFACHNGYESCFYRTLKEGIWTIDKPRIIDPKSTYKNL